MRSKNFTPPQQLAFLFFLLFLFVCIYSFGFFLLRFLIDKNAIATNARRDGHQHGVGDGVWGTRELAARSPLLAYVQGGAMVPLRPSGIPTHQRPLPTPRAHP